MLHSPNLLSKLEDAIHRSGYAGDTRPAVISYLVINSRLLEQPLNVAYISQSASGKNTATDAILPLFPVEAYYLVKASSPRALIYSDEPFAHRIVVLTEAGSLPEEGPAASAIRSLMSDREMSYEVVEKGEDGKHVVRHISKPGPTGNITTSTKPLGDQASTRMLTVGIADTPEQTRLVLHAQADRSNGALAHVDLSAWIALQRWLELAGDQQVVIPFAHALTDAVPSNTVRMRRDFSQLLTVVGAIALLHQRQRDGDPQGRIIATLDDYSRARDLLEEIFTTTVHEGATPVIIQTVHAVAELSKDRNPASEQDLVKKLSLAKSTINYRVRRALTAGWLVNQTISVPSSTIRITSARYWTVWKARHRPIPMGMTKTLVHPLPVVLEQFWGGVRSHAKGGPLRPRVYL